MTEGRARRERTEVNYNQNQTFVDSQAPKFTFYKVRYYMNIKILYIN